MRFVFRPSFTPKRAEAPRSLCGRLPNKTHPPRTPQSPQPESQRAPPHRALLPATMTGRTRPASHAATASAARASAASSQGQGGRVRGSSGSWRRPKEGWGISATSLRGFGVRRVGAFGGSGLLGYSFTRQGEREFRSTKVQARSDPRPSPHPGQARIPAAPRPNPGQSPVKRAPFPSSRPRACILPAARASCVPAS